MKEVKIKIKDIEYTVKQNFRGLMLFEEITGKAEPTEKLNDLMILFYCFLKGANKLTFEYTYDEFIDLIDEDQTIFQEFAKYLQDLQEVNPTEQKKTPKTAKN